MASQAGTVPARRHRASKKGPAPAPPAPGRRVELAPLRAVALPVAFAALVAAATLLPGFVSVPAARWSCWGAAAVLLAWSVVLCADAARRQRLLTVEISLRGQHYIQACAHLTIYTYWSAYWTGVGDASPLIAAQLAFAYGFDVLLGWSRRSSYTLGFGPFPIIFSTNLFLWFKPEWFYLQFLMVAIGFCGREFVRWQRDGRSVHIFNPSSFPLSLVSIALILTQRTHLTWGQEIATTQLYPPHMYLVIFLVSLPGQILFGVARMTVSAVATTYVLMWLHYLLTGSHLFESPTIPIAVFLGMHLLFTDPSTSPRSEPGRIIFGVLYGASVAALYLVLERFGVPTFYDKLLPVPMLNLMVRAIDRAVQSERWARFTPGALLATLTPRGRNLAYTALWATVFAVSQLVTANATMLARADALLADGRYDDAVGRYRDLIAQDPSRFEGHNKLGYALMRTGRPQEALPAIRRALELAPKNAEAHNNLGLALIQVGQVQEAIASMRTAVSLDPAYAEGRYNLGHALLAAAQPAAAAEAFHTALRARPDWPPALGSLAWLEATDAGGVRNADEALRLASRAVELTGRRDAQMLDVLAAAYAAAGRFPDAVATGEAAFGLAAPTQPEFAKQIEARLGLYRLGRPLVSGR